MSEGEGTSPAPSDERWWHWQCERCGRMHSYPPPPAGPWKPQCDWSHPLSPMSQVMPRREAEVRAEEREQASKPTHICLDCGALGYASGYHDHGGGEAGDTCSIEELRTSYIGIVQRLEAEAEDRVAEVRAEERAATLREVTTDLETWIEAKRPKSGDGVLGEFANGASFALDRLSEKLAEFAHFNPEAENARD